MFTVVYGTDRTRVRDKAREIVERTGVEILRITDTHTLEDLAVALTGPGMFGTPRTIVLEYILDRIDMRDHLEKQVTLIGQSPETIVLIEEKLDALAKKKFAPYLSASLDVPKKNTQKSRIFAIGDALKRKDRKTTWIAYQQALLDGAAPEAIHGMLFWALKDAYTKARSHDETQWLRRMLRELVALPHEARRRGEDLEYALESFVLSKM